MEVKDAAVLKTRLPGIGPMPSGLSGKYGWSARTAKVTVNMTALNASRATAYCFQPWVARAGGPPIPWKARVQPSARPAGRTGSMAQVM